jgi:hypothetical protein
MGVDNNEIPIRLDSDDAVARAAYRSELSPWVGNGLFWSYLVMGLCNVSIAALGLAQRRPFFEWGAQLALGIVFPAQAVLRYGRPQMHFPTEFTADESGLSFLVRGRPSPTFFPWKRVRSVEFQRDVFVVTAFRRWPWTRLACIQRPADPAVADALFALFYRSMVGTRGLVATPAARLGRIENSKSAFVFG